VGDGSTVGDASSAHAGPWGIPPIADQAINIARHEDGLSRFRSEFTVTSGTAVADRSEILPPTGARHRSGLADPAEDFTLTIWDNASTDGTQQYLKREEHKN